MKKFIILAICLIGSITYALQGAKYLIITPDSFVQAVQPLANWKTKKGVKAVVVPLSVTGNTASLIRNYIINAYNTWDIRPEYILLAGFGNVLPASGTSDDYYGDISGNYEIELSVGRLPCSNVNQCNMLVAKILGYERTPYITDSLWFRKGTTIIREDNPPDAYYQADCRYIRNLMLAQGFVQTDSFLSTAGNNSTDVMNAINNGRSYVIFRGTTTVNWWSPFDQVNPSNMTNGFKLPVVISGSCVTLSLNTTGYQADRFLLAGTAQNPKGAVAYFGTTTSGSYISLPRSIVSKGFFQALFQENKFILGDATKRAKFILDSVLHDQTRYKEWNFLGDPELNLWTATPRSIAVHHDTIINTQQQTYNVSVTCNNIPLTGALVCLMKDTSIYQYGYTDSTGVIWSIKYLYHKTVPKLPGADLAEDICRLSASRGYRLFLFGGEIGVAMAAKKKLISKFKSLHVVGTIDGIKVDPGTEDPKLISKINQSKSDIVFVGLGAPKQDLWIANNMSKLNSKIFIGLGGTLDYISGKIPRAPKIMRNLGLEWLYRLLRQPRRLKRISNALIVFPVKVIFSK